MIPKRLSLSNEETDNIIGREKFLGYIQDLVERDINVYISQVILPRLGEDPKDKEFKLSPDRKSIEVKQKAEEAKIIIPNGKKV